MSFGTAEHFFNKERQKIFEVHANAVRSGGLVIIWVPNKHALLFNFVLRIREKLGRATCPADEIPFTYKELRMRADRAGLTDIDVRAGEILRNDFSHHIIDFPRWFGAGKDKEHFISAEDAAKQLRFRISQNRAKIYLWNNLFCYSLILIGRKP